MNTNEFNHYNVPPVLGGTITLPHENQPGGNNFNKRENQPGGGKHCEYKESPPGPAEGPSMKLGAIFMFTETRLTTSVDLQGGIHGRTAVHAARAALQQPERDPSKDKE